MTEKILTVVVSTSKDYHYPPSERSPVSGHSLGWSKSRGVRIYPPVGGALSSRPFCLLISFISLRRLSSLSYLGPFLCLVFVFGRNKIYRNIGFFIYPSHRFSPIRPVLIQPLFVFR